jgi:hypothetical protein
MTTILWASTACYKESLPLLLQCVCVCLFVHVHASDEILCCENETLKTHNIHNKTHQWISFLLRCHYRPALPSVVAW